LHNSIAGGPKLFPFLHSRFGGRLGLGYSKKVTQVDYFLTTVSS